MKWAVLFGALALVLLLMVTAVFMRPAGPARQNVVIPTKSEPPATTSNRLDVAEDSRRAEFVQLADEVLNGLEVAFVRIDLVKCGRGKEEKAERFYLAVDRLRRSFPVGEAAEVDEFVRESVGAVAKLRHLCFLAASGSLGGPRPSIDEIYQHKQRATEIFRAKKLG